MDAHWVSNVVEYIEERREKSRKRGYSREKKREPTAIGGASHLYRYRHAGALYYTTVPQYIYIDLIYIYSADIHSVFPSLLATAAPSSLEYLRCSALFFLYMHPTVAL